MNKSMKRLCVLVASALSVANVNNSQAMKEYEKCNVQKLQYINKFFLNMLENEIENNNEINNTYDNDRPKSGENSLIRRNNFNESENENNTGKYEDLTFEQVDNLKINSNDNDEIIYNNDYNNGTVEEGYYPEPDEPEFTKEELEKRLKLIEEQSIVGQGDIENRNGFPFDGFNINQSAVDNEFRPECPSPDNIIDENNFFNGFNINQPNINNKFLPKYPSSNEIIDENNFGNNASMQNNTNPSNYAPVTTLDFEERLQQRLEYMENMPLSKSIAIPNIVDQDEGENEPNLYVGEADQYSQDNSDSGDDHEINYVEPGQPKQYIIPNDELLLGLKVILNAPSPYYPSDIPSPFVRCGKFSLHDILSAQTPFLAFLKSQLLLLKKPIPDPYFRYILSNVDFYVLTLGDEIVGAIGLKRMDCAKVPTVENAFVLLNPEKINQITSSLESSCPGIKDVIRKEIVRLSELVHCTYYYHIDEEGEIKKVDLDVFPLEQFDLDKLKYVDVDEAEY